MNTDEDKVKIIRGKMYQHVRDDLYAPLSFHPVAGGVLRRLGRLVTYQQILDAVGDCAEEYDLIDVKAAVLMKRWKEGR